MRDCYHRGHVEVGCQMLVNRVWQTPFQGSLFSADDIRKVGALLAAAAAVSFILGMVSEWICGA